VTVHASLHPTRTDRISVVGGYRDKDLIRSVPGASWSKKDDGWSVPRSWSSCLALRGIFQDRLVVAPDLSDWAASYQRETIAPALALREALDAPGDADLYPYQRAGVAFLSLPNLTTFSLEDDPGSGKTAQIIRALKVRHDRGESVFPALVVTPNSVKRSWEREFSTWWPEDGPTVSVVDGTAAKRRKQMEPGLADVYIINWESLRSHSRLAAYGSIALRRCLECGGDDATVTPAKCHAHEKELNAINFRTVIADEYHRAKDPAAAQTRALASAAHGAVYRYGVSGTIVANSPVDIWSGLHYLAPNEWPTKVKWIDRYVNYSVNPWGGTEIYGFRPDTKDEFFRTTDYMRRGLPKEITLPFLPPIVRETRDSPMVPAQQKVYKQMLDHLMARLDDGSLLTAGNPMTQSLRLLQFAAASGEILLDDKGNERIGLIEPSGKLDTFMEDVLAGDFDGQSVVVFTQSKQLLNLLGERMRKHEIGYCRITGDEDTDTRQKAIDDFQAGKYKFVLCTLGAGSTGITLTKASTMVFLQRSWSAVEMTQAQGRAHRIGSEQHESVFIIDYITPDTVEESVVTVLAEKAGYLEEVARSEDLIRRFLKGEL
jgi:SNF2 family DNA or RNA helicase